MEEIKIKALFVTAIFMLLGLYVMNIYYLTQCAIATNEMQKTTLIMKTVTHHIIAVLRASGYYDVPEHRHEDDGGSIDLKDACPPGRIGHKS